jgi:riboflavin biosynthesis pyrimidine reductase
MRRIHPLPAETVEPLQLLREEDRPPPPDRPWVMLNMVSSLDGRAQGADGRSGPLSGPADRALFRALRATADVVLAGAGTARTENYGPVLLSDQLRRQRLSDGRVERPRLAVVTNSLNLDTGGRLFEEQEEQRRTLILTTGAARQAHPDPAEAVQG